MYINIYKINLSYIKMYTDIYIYEDNVNLEYIINYFKKHNNKEQKRNI